MIKVLFVCHGNICRSTMAESLMTHKLKKLGLSHEFIIDSAGTSSCEKGSYVHDGTLNKLKEKGIDVVPHYAKKMTREDYDYFDYILLMDDNNINNIKRIVSEDDMHKIYKIMSFNGKDRDVADPWYTGDFETTYQDLNSSLDSFIKYILERKGVCK